MAFEEYKTVEERGVFLRNAVGLGKAMLWAFGLTAAVFAAAALLLTYTPLPESIIPFVAILTAIFCAAAGGAAASRRAGKMGWLNGSLAGVLYGVILCVISFFTEDGLRFGGYLAVLLAICLFSGAIGGIVGINLSGRRKR